MAVCTIEECERKVSRRRWCKAHYERWRKYGSPLSGVPIGTSAKRIDQLHERNDLASNQTKRCAKCKAVKSFGEFSKDPRPLDGLRCYCKPCRRDNTLKRKYGITQKDFNALLERQGHCCALCNLPFGLKNTVAKNVDHNHKTGEVRGILCTHCNISISLFEDRCVSPQLAQDYIDQKGMFNKEMKRGA